MPNFWDNDPVVGGTALATSPAPAVPAANFWEADPVAAPPASATPAPTTEPQPLAPAKPTMHRMLDHDLPVVGQWNKTRGKGDLPIVSYPLPTKQDPNHRLFLVDEGGQHKTALGRMADGDFFRIGEFDDGKRDVFTAGNPQAAAQAQLAVEAGDHAKAHEILKASQPASDPFPLFSQPNMQKLIQSRSPEKYAAAMALQRSGEELLSNGIDASDHKLGNEMIADAHAKLESAIPEENFAAYMTEKQQVERGRKELTPPRLMDYKGRTKYFERLKPREDIGDNVPIDEGVLRGDHEAARLAYQKAVLAADGSGVAGRTATRFAEGVNSVTGAVARPFLPAEVNDEMVRNRGALGQAMDSVSGPVEKTVGGVVQSAGTLAGAAPLIASGVGAPSAFALAAGAATGNEAITTGRDAGLRGAKLASYVGTAAAIETGITMAMNKIPGFGGIETTVMSALKKRLIPNLTKRIVKSTVGELTEEESIMLASAISDHFHGVDPKALDPDKLKAAAWETAKQTLAMIGAINTPAGIRKGVAAFTQRNPKQAAAIAQLDSEAISRGDLSKAGLDTESAPSTAQERHEIVAAVNSELASAPPPAVEPGKPFKLPTPVTKWSKVEPGDMVAYQGMPATVKRRSDSGNKFDIYTADAHYSNVDRRQLDGWAKTPKTPELLPDSQPTDIAPEPTSQPKFEPPPNELNPRLQPNLEGTPNAPLETPPTPQVPPVDQAAVKAPPPVKPGFVRMYHGGDPDHDGKRWLSPYQDYAQGYADKSEGGKVFYIDLPESDPRLEKSFDDSGTGQKAPYMAFEADEKTSRQMKPLGSAAVAQPATVAEPIETNPAKRAAKLAASKPLPPLNPVVEVGVRKRYKEAVGQDLGKFVEPEAAHAEAKSFLDDRKIKHRWFRSELGDQAHSAYDPETKTIYLNADAKDADLWYLVGHEFAHATGADARLADLPSDVIDKAKIDYARGASPTYLAKLQKNDSLWTREAVARYMGEVLADPAKRNELRRSAPTLLQKIIESVKSLFVGKKMPDSVRRVLSEFGHVPTEAKEASAQEVTPTPPKSTAAAHAASPAAEAASPTTPKTKNGDPSRYDTYAGFANALEGSAAGEMAQAVNDVMGDNPHPKITNDDLVAQAEKKFKADPKAARAEVERALAAEGVLSNDQFVLASVVKADLAQRVLSYGEADDLASLGRIQRAYTLKASKAGSALQSLQVQLMQTPAGRRMLVAQELTALSDREQKALDAATADLKRFGGSEMMLSDSGMMLADSPINKVLAEKNPEEKSRVKAAMRDNNSARAAAAVLRIQKQIAARQAKFKARMEKKGVLPSSPAGIAAMESDIDLAFRTIRELRAWNNLARGKAIPFTGGRVGVKGLTDALFELSQANILSGLKTVTLNIAGTPANYLLHLVPRGIAATGNAAASAVSGGRLGKEGPQLGEFKHLLAGLVDAWKPAWKNAFQSAIHETSMLDRQSGLHGSTLEALGGDYAIPGYAGRIARLPGYGSNRFGDDLTRTFIAHAEARSRAYRDAIETGAKDVGAHVQKLYADPESVAWKDAHEEANKMASQEKGGETRQGIKNALSSARKKIPGVRWFLRFVNFPVNAAVQTTEWTPLHFWHVASRIADNMDAQRPMLHGIKTDVAKAFVGTLAIYAMMDDLEDEEEDGDFGISGASHPNQDRRNTVRFGDTRVNYSRFDPFGSALSLLADTGLAIKKHGLGGKASIASMASIGDTIVNKPVMRGIRDMVDLGADFQRSRKENDPAILEKAAKKLAASQTLSFLPRIISQFGEATGDETGYDKRNRTMGELFDIEHVNAAAQYDAWGEKKSLDAFGNPYGDYAWRLFTPINVEVKSQHAGDKFIGKWNSNLPEDEKPFRIPQLTPRWTVKGKVQNMDAETFQRYAELSGRVAARLFEQGNYDPEHPTKEQVESLTRNFSTARDKAKDILKAEIADGKRVEVTPDLLAVELRRERIRSLADDLKGPYMPKKGPKETAEKYRQRVAKERESRIEKAAELRRLRGGKG